jgi:hypothetical protein
MGKCTQTDVGNVNALSLYDLDRNIRSVGTAFKELIRQWQLTFEETSYQLNFRTGYYK